MGVMVFARRYVRKRPARLATTHNYIKVIIKIVGINYFQGWLNG